MQFRFRCAAVLTAVLLCSAAALPALAEETATPETADSASTYTGWKTVNGKDYWYENGVKQGCLPGIQRRQMGALRCKRPYD